MTGFWAFSRGLGGWGFGESVSRITGFSLNVVLPGFRSFGFRISGLVRGNLKPQGRPVPLLVRLEHNHMVAQPFMQQAEVCLERV